MVRKLKAPFPWFGGKSQVSDLVWERFGDVKNYVEPFFGSGAVLLGRHQSHYDIAVETVNDKDCMIANFWRAVQKDPKSVAKYADCPVNEAELHARHRWIIEQKPILKEKAHNDMEWYDPKIAGIWVWGMSSSIGNCFQSNTPTQGVPHLGNSGRGVNRPTKRKAIKRWMKSLADRLRYVRVCCGDWKRVCGESILFPNNSKKVKNMGVTGVFLDPPYAGYDKLYSQQGVFTEEIMEFISKWESCEVMRIALCGYEGEYDLPEWEVVKWKAKGGYGLQRKVGKNKNNHRERIWFSPHCLSKSSKNTLFEF